MARLVNKYGCEPIFQRALERDPYSKKGSDFSITELISPAAQQARIRQAGDSLEVDVSTRVAASIGTGFHLFIEKGAREGIDIIEKRYFATFGEYIVSAQIDLLETDLGRLVDWKTSKVFPFTPKGGNGNKPEFVAQLNGQLEILRRNNLDAKSLHIVGVLKDHDKKCLDKSSRYYTPGYPEVEMKTVDIEIWSREKTTNWIEERISAHLFARELKDLALCSSAETWGGRRCASYCDVSSQCSQYKQAQKTGLIGG